MIRQDYAQFLKLLSGEIFDQNLTQWENRDHPMGTVIMGHDPRDSVVNAEGRSMIMIIFSLRQPGSCLRHPWSIRP